MSNRLIDFVSPQNDMRILFPCLPVSSTGKFRHSYIQNMTKEIKNYVSTRNGKFLSSEHRFQTVVPIFVFILFVRKIRIFIKTRSPSWDIEQSSGFDQFVSENLGTFISFS